MGTLKTFLESNGITEEMVVAASKRLESTTSESRTLQLKRLAKRKGKETAAKSYAELEIAKPAQMGRGISTELLASAVADKSVGRKVRTKIYRAVSNILAAKKKPAAEFKALFEGTKARAGKKVEVKKK